MKINETIVRLQAEIGEQTTTLDSLAAIRAEREWTPDEQKAINTAQDRIKALRGDLEALEAMERMSASRASPAGQAAAAGALSNGTQVGAGAVSFSGKTEQTDAKLAPGVGMARVAMCIAKAGGNAFLAAELAKQHFKDTPSLEAALRAQAVGIPAFGAKAAVAPGTTTDAAWAGALVYASNLTSEFIEFLRPMTVIGRISGMRRVPFNVRINRMTSGLTSVGWVGQGMHKPAGKAGFDFVTLPWAKMAVIIGLTDELVRFSDPSAELLMRDELASAMAEYADRQFTDPTVAAVASVSPGAITNGAPGAAATGTGSVADITTDLKAAITALTNGNIAMRNPYWLMSNRSFTYLLLQRTAQDVFAWRDELSRGTLLGIPVLASNYIRTDLPAGTNSTVTLLDANELFLAEDPAVSIDVSREATIQMSDAPPEYDAGPPANLIMNPAMVSAWQQNLMLLRAERYQYWMRRRDAAVYNITAVPW